VEALWSVGGWALLAGSLLALVMLPVALYGPWRGRTLFALIWWTVFYVGTLSTQIESYVFTELPLSTLRTAVLEDFVSALVLAGLMVSLLGKGAPLKESPKVPQTRWLSFSWAWRLLLCAVVYLFLYLVVGGITYEMFTKPFYQDPSLPLKSGENIDLFSTLMPLQLVRGGLLAVAVFPLVRGLQVRRRTRAIILGLILWIVGGLAPLLLPNAYLPSTLRLYHAVEIFFQNFPFGVAIVRLLGKDG